MVPNEQCIHRRSAGSARIGRNGETTVTNRGKQDGHDLRGVSDQLETARSLIEDRFLKGGAALMTAHDLVTGLLTALEGFASGLSNEAADTASDKLVGTMAHLARLVEAEKATQGQLAAIAANGREILPQIKDMQGALHYLSTCAIETRIAGAAVPEFLSFADDVTNYVRSASEQVAVFAARVTALNTELVTSSDGRAGRDLAASVPQVTAALDDAVGKMQRRRAELRRLAQSAEAVARGVAAKVAKVLSALQIGDVTRQRIEHVQAGLALLGTLLDASAADGDDTALTTVAIGVLGAQTDGLIRDFHEGTRTIVDTIEGLGEEAKRILALTNGSTGGTEDPMIAIEDGIHRARAIVLGIEANSDRAAAAYAATREVATELLSNMGSIGNLRNVRDDIRCLAINAYLRCNRIGEKGRAVGVVAAEMNNYATRLGSAAEAILDRLTSMERATAGIGGDEGRVDLAGDLDFASDTLRGVCDVAIRHLSDVTTNGSVVSERIGKIVSTLDFRSDLGNHLEDCRRYFSNARGAEGLTDPRLAEFSARLFDVYTMASERDIHRALLPIGLSAAPDSSVGASEAAADYDTLDDALF